MQLVISTKCKRFASIFGHKLLMLATLFLVGCGGGSDDLETLSASSRVHPNFSKKAYNKPYQIKGVWYTPQPHYHINEEGIASYYGGTDVFHGRKTSNGEIFDMNEVSAAHKTAPIPCVLQITNLENGRSLKVKVNDRGPFIDGRIIDVSRRTAQLLGFYRQGTAKVHIKTLMPETMILVQGHTNEVDPDLTQQTLLAQNIPSQKQKPKPQTPAPITPQNHESILLALKDEIAEFSQEVEHKVKRPVTPNGAIQRVNYPVSSSKNVSSETYNTASFNPCKQDTMRRPLQKNLNKALNKGVFVQAGTFTYPQQAQQAKMLIERTINSMPVRLESVKFSKKQLYRVVVGPCHNGMQAEQVANHIKMIKCSMPKNSIVVFNG